MPVPLAAIRPKGPPTSGPPAWQRADLKLALFSDQITANDGDLVATWPDVSGNSLSATAAGAARPTYKTAIVNGYPVVRFGGSQGMATPAINLTGTKAVTVYLVVSTTVLNQYEVLLESSENFNNHTDAFAIYQNDLATSPSYAIIGGGKGDAGGSQSETGAGPVLSPGVRVLCMTIDRDLASNETNMFLDGNSYASNYGNNNNTNALGNYPLYIGSRTGPALGITGDMAAVLLYTTAHDTATRQAITAFLYSRYGGPYGFVVQQAHYFDSAIWTYNAAQDIAGEHQYRTSVFSRVQLNTAATSLTIQSWRYMVDLWKNSYLIRRNGVDLTTLSLDGSGSGTVVLAGGNQLIEIVSACQNWNLVGDPTTAIQFINPRQISADATVTPVTATVAHPRLVVYGDSITVGYKVTNCPAESWPQLVREAWTAYNGGSLAMFGWASLALYHHADTAGHRAALVAQLLAYSPDTLYVEIGYNDYYEAWWNAANFGTAYAALLDDLHAASPSLVIYCQNLSVSTNNGANAMGSTLQDYRDQIATAAAARPTYVTLIDGLGAGWPVAGDLVDFVHPNTAGNAKIATQVKTVLGIP